MTNAIKFIRGRPEKKIKVSLGASVVPFPPTWNGISFAAGRTTTPQDILSNEDWGDGPKAYIWITVKDTGCGLSPAEQGNLFTRFSQATPRTHVQYGGSGLGLFISKSLAELQGGNIGVSSEANVGSTFAFYIGTRIVRPSRMEMTRRSSMRPEIERSTSTEQAVKEAHYSVLIVEDNLVNVR